MGIGVGGGERKREAGREVGRGECTGVIRERMNEGRKEHVRKRRILLQDTGGSSKQEPHN